MDGGVVTFILAILIVAVFVFVAILLTGKRKYIFNREAYQTKFLSIENKLNKDNPTSFTATIIEADKLKWASLVKPWGIALKNPATNSAILTPFGAPTNSVTPSLTNQT